MNTETKSKFVAARAEVDAAMTAWRAVVANSEADLAAEEQAKQAYKAACRVASAAAGDAGMEDEAFLYEYSSL